METLNQSSLPLLLWLQSLRSPALDQVMTALSQMGREEFYILIFPWVFWCLSRRAGIMGALGLLLSAYLADFIKWGLALPRPSSPPATILWPETSPGFVSSHASTSLGFWGSLAAGASRWRLMALALLFSFGVGVSRVYLGSHFPTDVLGGWMVGALSIGLGLAILQQGWRLRALQPGPQIALLCLGCGLMMAFFPTHGPAAVTAPAVLFGFGLGLILTRALECGTGGPPEQRVARYCLGMAVTLAGSLGLASLGPGLVVRFLRYAYLGFAIGGLGPWLFVRLGLCPPNRGRPSEDEDAGR